jgi:hypothetical protein
MMNILPENFKQHRLHSSESIKAPTENSAADIFSCGSSFNTFALSFPPGG